MLRRIFRRSFPEMSELAKNFIVSMSSKLLILAGILLALSNIGVQIGPILAGLGIMGFIIGFALQDTLSNFASGLMILIYRPYDIGDKIISARRERQSQQDESGQHNDFYVRESSTHRTQQKNME